MEQLPNDWAINLNKEKDSLLMSKFIYWAENHKDYIANKVTDKHICNYLGYFMNELSYCTVSAGYTIITLEQWHEHYFPKWIPKQGEMILTSSDGINYNERKFVVLYDLLYYCESHTTHLMGFKYAKPLSSQLQDKIDELKLSAKELGLKINVTFE
jgi:hypothetical protein